MSQPPTPQNPTDSELHYKSLIELLKYGVTLITYFLGAIAIILGFITWDNGKDMREELKAARKEMSDNIKEMKGEVNEQKKELREKQNQLSEDFKLASDRLNIDLERLRKDAISQIGDVKDESIATAKRESRNAVEDVFKSSNIEKFIVDVAKKKLEPKISDVVTRQINDYDINKNKQLSTLQLIQDIYHSGETSADGVFKLDSISSYSDNEYMRNVANEYLNKLKVRVNPVVDMPILKEIWKTNKNIILEHLNTTEPRKYNDRLLENGERVIDALYIEVKNPNTYYPHTAKTFYFISKLLQRNIGMFNYGELEKVYRQYKKKPYSLNYDF